MGFFTKADLERIRAEALRKQKDTLRDYEDAYDNDEWETESDCDCITRDEVIQIWENIEHHRAAIAQQLAIFDRWLEISSELHKDWVEFTNLGGVTAHELRRFLDGDIIRRRSGMRTRGNLRLIVNKNKRPAVRVRTGDDDAA